MGGCSWKSDLAALDDGRNLDCEHGNRTEWEGKGKLGISEERGVRRKQMCLSLGSIRATVDSEPVEYRRNHRSGIRLISSIPSTGGCAHVSFKFDQLKLSRIRKKCREVGDSENRACEISLARLSPRLLRRRESKHLVWNGAWLGGLLMIAVLWRARASNELSAGNTPKNF